MPSKAATVTEYLAELPEDRQKAIKAVRATIKKNLPKEYKEVMQYGMIGYAVPHSIYPDGYHCDPKQPLPFVQIGNQKNHMAVYLFCIYMDPDLTAWFKKAWAATGKKLDMGASCVRFKKVEDLPLEVIGEAVARMPIEKFIERYEASKPGGAKRAAKKTAKKSAKKVTKKVAKKAAKKAAKKFAKKTTKKAKKKVSRR